MARVVERRVSEFNAQYIANMAWAFGTVKHRNEKLFAAVARAVERRLSGEHALRDACVLSAANDMILRRTTSVTVRLSWPHIDVKIQMCVCRAWVELN